ncbi:hypothetical protein EBB79_15360 [Parasedimentitalea marina]|uniref:Uncharacterized protein n=1 Tax=Parasedimentitalea marina TaxID=2483033 RepID=A0A3T0N521_9RHOB|nr:hypothetical protein EBB79_15360 [Parasedimentitalea marina]
MGCRFQLISLCFSLPVRQDKCFRETKGLPSGVEYNTCTVCTDDLTEFTAIELERSIALIENDRLEEGISVFRQILETSGLAGSLKGNLGNGPLDPFSKIILRRLQRLDTESAALSMLANEMGFETEVSGGKK